MGKGEWGEHGRGGGEGEGGGERGSLVCLSYFSSTSLRA